jgi:hypothetical protein
MKVVIDDKDYNIRPLTIEQYLALKENKDINEVELISMMIDVPVDVIKRAPMPQVKFVAKMLMSELGNLDDVSPLVLDLDFNGTYYGLLKPSKMSYEEWINMEVFMAQKPVNLLKLATHLYRPILGDKFGDDRKLIPYDLAECEARETEFRAFPVNIVLSALFFLTTFAKTLTEDFLSSTHKTTPNNENLKNLLPRKK